LDINRICDSGQRYISDLSLKIIEGDVRKAEGCRCLGRAKGLCPERLSKTDTGFTVTKKRACDMAGRIRRLMLLLILIIVLSCRLPSFYKLSPEHNTRLSELKHGKCVKYLFPLHPYHPLCAVFHVACSL
jgi:hypothetical protein